MAKDVKRVSLYFNLENEFDNKQWEYLNRLGKKPKDEIKRLIEMAMLSEDISVVEVEKTSTTEKINKSDIDPGIGVGF